MGIAQDNIGFYISIKSVIFVRLYERGKFT